MVYKRDKFTIYYKEETGSTNDDAMDLAKNGAEDYTLVWAKTQNSGRGRLRRKWVSEAGNLYWSTVIRVEDITPPIQELALIVALSIGRTLSAFLPDETQVKYKWPNDTLVNNKKISGVLIETSLKEGWAVVGIGINVQLAPEIKNILYEATSLLRESGKLLEVSTVCEELCKNFYELNEYWKESGFDKSLRDEYCNNLWRLGERIRVGTNLDKTEFVEGINLGIDGSGALLIQTENGIITILSGDLH